MAWCQSARFTNACPVPKNINDPGRAKKTSPQILAPPAPPCLQNCADMRRQEQHGLLQESRLPTQSTLRNGGRGGRPRHHPSAATIFSHLPVPGAGCFGHFLGPRGLASTGASWSLSCKYEDLVVASLAFQSTWVHTYTA